jgi:autotransporter-associated beta strand protein
VTNNGTLRLVRQDALMTYAGPITGSGRVQIGANNVNFGVITLTGTNTYTGGTFIGGNTLVLGDGINPGFGTITGAVQFVNNFTLGQDNARTIIFNRPDDFTFSGTITTNFAAPQFNQGTVQQIGTGRMTLTGNNTYGSGTVIGAGILQVGAGGSSGSLGFGNVTDNSGLVFNRTGTLAVGTVTGTGAITNMGTGTVTLRGASSIGGDLNLWAGTFGAAPAGQIGSLTVGGTLTVSSGVTVLAGVNRALSPSNSVYTVTGAIVHAGGGTLKVINGGPTLQIGDKFFIFNQAVPSAMAVTSPGYTFQNDLAIDGSITVSAVAAAPSITTTFTGPNQVALTWQTNWIGGVHLQAQTNTLSQGLRNNWVTIPNTDLTNFFTATIAKTNPAVFYRLINP